MDLKELDNIAKQQERAFAKIKKILDEYPDTIQVYFEDGTAYTKGGEEFDYGRD